MKIASRNVNGIRAVLAKGFYDRVKKNDRDIICLQETKAFESQLPAEFRFHMNDYNRVRHAGTKPGYAGTATLYKKSLNLISSKSHFADLEHFHEDGRVVETKFSFSSHCEEHSDAAILEKENNKIASHSSQGQGFTLLNIYFPNGNNRSDGTEMLSYKLKFYEHFIHYINTLRSNGEDIITTGDFNICHRPIDIARPKENENSIGFLPIERAEMDKLLENGYTDVFRHFNPDLSDQYTRWSYRAGARPRNVGRRLDYFRVSQNIIPMIKNIIHQTSVEGSDHCPISLELSL
ncbi:exodeoxyribonuclease III [Candidatus Gracilibacteria bacterium]|nr:exodeoxyribonuclease III [Candidatus Gracilibacteria bacterium]